MTTFIGQLMAGLRCALEPLDNAFTNEKTLRDFFAEFGWDLTATPASVATIKAGFALESSFATAISVANQLEAGTGDTAALVGQLKDAVVGLIGAVKALSA